MRRLLSLVSLLAVAFGTLAPSPASASSPGVSVTAYKINEVPPARSETAYPICGTRVDPFINIQYEYQPIGDCGDDEFLVHYEGFVTVPEGVTSIRFAIATDDGSYFTIAGTSFGDWSDKGCSVDYAPRLAFSAGQSLPLDGWVYENGGGTCAMLFWQFENDQADWSIVPPEAFTTDGVAPTSTTSTTTTSTSTTTTSTSTTSTTSTTIPVTTTSQKVPTSTNSPSSTAAPATSVQPIATTSSTVSSTPTTIAVIIAPTSTLNAPTTTTTSTLVPETTSTTSVPTSPEMRSEEAVAKATDPKIVASLSPEEAAEVFAAIDESALTLEEAAQIVAAVQNAPDEVREEFESKVNVFGGKTDNYVPLFSTIPVGKRRTMIAATGMMTVVPVPTRRRMS